MNVPDGACGGGCLEGVPPLLVRYCPNVFCTGACDSANGLGFGLAGGGGPAPGGNSGASPVDWRGSCAARPPVTRESTSALTELRIGAPAVDTEVPGREDDEGRSGEILAGGKPRGGVGVGVGASGVSRAPGGLAPGFGGTSGALLTTPAGGAGEFGFASVM